MTFKRGVGFIFLDATMCCNCGGGTQGTVASVDQMVALPTHASFSDVSVEPAWWTLGFLSHQIHQGMSK